MLDLEGLLKGLGESEKVYEREPEESANIATGDIKSLSADKDPRRFGKPIPEVSRRKDESKFQHKIRQWTEEVKDRPKRFPGGKKQAIAIAAQQSGMSKSTSQAIDMLKAFGGIPAPTGIPTPSATGQRLSGGEGARGGHVIGHTTTGKPIYGPSQSHVEAHRQVSTQGPGSPGHDRLQQEGRNYYSRVQDYEPSDHQDAYYVHQQASGQYEDPMLQQLHRDLADQHRESVEFIQGQRRFGKALTSRDLYIPKTIEDYDPYAVWRSATTTTTRRHSKLAGEDVAPLVGETFQHINDRDKLRAEEDQKRALYVKSARERHQKRFETCSKSIGPVSIHNYRQ